MKTAYLVTFLAASLALAAPIQQEDRTASLDIKGSTTSVDPSQLGTEALFKKATPTAEAAGFYKRTQNEDSPESLFKRTEKVKHSDHILSVLERGFESIKTLIFRRADDVKSTASFYKKSSTPQAAPLFYRTEEQGQQSDTLFKKSTYEELATRDAAGPKTNIFARAPANSFVKNSAAPEDLEAREAIAANEFV